MIALFFYLAFVYNQNLIRMLIARFWDVVTAAKKACCHDFIMSLPDGYSTVIGEGGATLSGGGSELANVVQLVQDHLHRISAI